MTDVSQMLRLAAELEASGRLAPGRVGTELGKGADAIRDTAKANVSRNLSSRFARGIISRREKSGGPAAYVLVAGDILGPVIRTWEVGNARNAPRPSIGPAVEQHEEGIISSLSRIVDL
jgi:hypothetical protein